MLPAGRAADLAVESLASGGDDTTAVLLAFVDRVADEAPTSGCGPSWPRSKSNACDVGINPSRSRGAGWQAWCAGTSPTTPSSGVPPPRGAALVLGAAAPQPAHPPHLGADAPPHRPLVATRPHPASLPTNAFRRPHPRQEPSAVIPHAGISAGAARKGGPYRDRHRGAIVMPTGRACPLAIAFRRPRLDDNVDQLWTLPAARAATKGLPHRR